jgi:hypothetical protein
MTPTASNSDSSLREDLMALVTSYGIDEPEYNPSKAVDELLVIIEAECTKRERSEKSRYCGHCYKPSIERGGWWCPEHAYDSVYISQEEARYYRTEQAQQSLLSELEEWLDYVPKDTIDSLEHARKFKDFIASKRKETYGKNSNSL